MSFLYWDVPNTCSGSHFAQGRKQSFSLDYIAIQILPSAVIMSLTLSLPVLFLAYSIPVTPDSLLFVNYHRPQGLLLGYVFSDKHMVNFFLPSGLLLNIFFEMRPILITHVKISTCSCLSHLLYSVLLFKNHTYQLTTCYTFFLFVLPTDAFQAEVAFNTYLWSLIR